MQPLEPSSEQQPKRRQIRLERRPKAQLAEGDSQGWAVSYSDMLMVLMSFFVLFFSYEPEKRQNLVNQIALELRAKQGATSAPPDNGGGGAGGAAVSTVQPRARPAAEPAAKEAAARPSLDAETLAANLTRLAIPVRKDAVTHSLLIDFPDNLFPPRAFDLDADGRAEFEKVLAVLLPHQDSMSVAIIGYADSAPLSRATRLLSNNVELGALRGSHALSLAVAFGFKAEALTIESGSGRRDTRSLALRIRERQER